MRAAFAGQRDARRRRHQNEARILVAGIVERIEAARDEGVVQRADRQQPLAVDAVREPKRRQHDEQVHLGDAEFDMLALGREFPIEGGRDALALEGVGHGLVREQPAPVHPGAEIGRNRHVGRRRDDMLREIVVAAADLVEQRAEAGLRRHHRLNGHR
jgi:hypothetical protein